MKSMWKQSLLGVAAAALVGGSAVQAWAVCGDLNNNGSVTSADCNIIFDVAAGPPNPAGLCGTGNALDCGDLNADGAVNAADGVICNNFVAGNETTYPLCSGPGTGVACPGGTKTYSADIGTNQRWPNTCTIVIDGTIKVSAGVIVTIDAGTTVKGKVVSGNGSPSALVFLRDSKVVANGTLAAPIVFTSGRDLPGQPGGARTKGDWGGLVLNGRAPTNVPGGEGLSEGLSNVPFGGNEANDSSGVLKFVRVEFAGRALSIDNELNLLTLNSVGAGTTIDHVQAHFGLDDCHEWFGGTVNEKFLVGSACGDDGLDWQLGYTGAVQFALVAQKIDVIESGGHGFEGDNNENGFALEPYSNPKFCNVTAIGTRGQVGTPAGANQVGALLRRGTKGVIANSIIVGFHKSGIELGNATPGCSGPTTLTGELLVRDSTVFDVPTNGTSVGAPNAPSPCTGAQFFTALETSYNLVTTDPGVSEAYPPANPKPTGTVTSAFNCNDLDGSLQNTTYKGAFDPAASTLWTDGWTAYPNS